MDISDTWLEHMLRDLLPPAYHTTLETYLLHPHSPFQILKRQVFSLGNCLLNITYPILIPLASRITSYIHSSPDIVFFAAVLSALYFVLVVLAWVRRIMMFWMRMLMRLLGLGLLVAIAAVMYQRGLESSMQELFALGIRLAGWGEVVRDVWVREYERYQEQERVQAQRGR